MLRDDCDVNVVGLGYIGLPTAALIARQGYVVNGVDTNESVVNDLNAHTTHINEPGLGELITESTASGKLFASLEPTCAKIHIICVPTPHKANGKDLEPDLSFVFSAAESLCKVVKEDDLIILESTCPIGTTGKLRDYFESQLHRQMSLHFAYCPERVLPGDILRELVDNDRIVGGLTPVSTAMASVFYRRFVSGFVYETTAETAELCKLAENSFRDVNIAFANELSIISEKFGINVWEVIKLANRHPRVNILNPGCGVGGHCIAVDPWFLIAENTKEAILIRAARRVNDSKTEWAIRKIKAKVSEIQGKVSRIPKIVCLGLSFKPDVADLRESPAEAIASTLSEEGYDILCVEPNIESHEALQMIDLKQGIEISDLVIVLVSHKQFKTREILDRISAMPYIDFTGLVKSN